MAKELILLCGGQSSEHAISLISAQNVLNSLRESGFSVSIVFISTAGRWFYVTEEMPLSQLSGISEGLDPIAPSMGNSKHPFVSLSDPTQGYSCDCVVPMLHGPMGEDGTIQGLLTLLNLPYVGPDILSSALCMHKAAAREILTGHGIESVPFYLVHANQWTQEELLAVYRDWDEDVYVKPVRMGSAVGISHVSSEADLFEAVKNAFRFDTQIMIEPVMHGREIEVAVRGALGCLEVAGPGEVCRGDVFYSYAEKYSASSQTRVQVPAELPDDVAENIRDQALEMAEILRCEGMVRVDGYLLESGDFLFSEANTIPGFTSISMYPKMWEHAGESNAQMLARLVDLAMKRFQQRSQLESSQPQGDVSV